MLSSQVLAGSDQLKRLLRMVVERALSGQSDLLKEYNLGLEVFYRPPDYDPKEDPIVRVQARRLRSKLDEYYAAEGLRDPILIQIPKGAYIPAFEVRSQPAEPHQPSSILTRRSALLLTASAVLLAAFLLAWQTRKAFSAPADRDRSVAVLPLQNYAGEGDPNHLADQFTEVLTTMIARNKNLRVLSHTTALKYRDGHSSLPEIARDLNVRWVVEGGVGTHGQRAYIKLRTVDARTDRKVWADVLDCDVQQIVAAGTGAAKAISSAIESRLDRAGN